VRSAPAIVFAEQHLQALTGIAPLEAEVAREMDWRKLTVSRPSSPEGFEAMSGLAPQLENFTEIDGHRH
jgi:hypothetical protein